MRKFSRGEFVRASGAAAAALALPLPALRGVAATSGWRVQSSARVRAGGAAVSSAAFATNGWYAAPVPSTVLAALLDDGLYANPFFGMNLRAIPGTSYPIGANFSNLLMPASSPFHVAWWYRTEFELGNDAQGKTVWLRFDGLNYRADVWLNGRLVADSKAVVGMWRAFEFDVSAYARPGERNVLAVEVSPPQEDDLAFTFVDWAPMPADKEMGLWRDVVVTTSGPVAIRDPQVVTRLEQPSLERAWLTLFAELRNTTSHTVHGVLRAHIGEITLAQTVALAPGEVRQASFAPAHYPQLEIAQPQVWWPADLGAQPLHELQLAFENDGAVSDRQSVRFGIREVTSELDERGYRLFKVNGRRILIRGAGWAPDLFLRVDPVRQEDEVRYVRDMHLNAIRLEGKLLDNHFFDLCDRYGILVIAGWCCCDHWERWKSWKPEDYVVAAASLRTQLRRLRNHPCMLVWLYGSDNPPPPDVEAIYLRILGEERWPNPHLSSASGQRTIGGGPTGVKMTGPYNYVTPNYWLEDTQQGGAFGFITETSPGPAVPPIESLRRMLPADHLWPIDDVWDFHCGGGNFQNLDLFTRALEARYGAATGVEDYARKSQLMTYESERAMFEAYRRNKYVSTGVVQWMLNNAWPGLIWHLYDYYLRPAGGYFGTKKACEPLHVQYSYDDRSIVVTNAYHRAFAGMTVQAAVYDLDANERFSKQSALDVPPDSSTRVFTLPEIAVASKTYLVRLELHDASGAIVSQNVYWLSTQPDVFDWANSTWYATALSAYADLTALATLPHVTLRVTSDSQRIGAERRTHVTVENPSGHIAFFVHLAVRKGAGGDEVLPILWEDNYVTLFPGERRTLVATYREAALAGTTPVVSIDGWNADAQG